MSGFEQQTACRYTRGGDGMTNRASSKVIHGDCSQLLMGGVERMTHHGLVPVIVTDPPFNIGYHYDGYKDNMPEAEYYAWMAEITALASSVVVLYPESLHKLSMAKGEAPERVVSWVYNSNTAKQHRDIAFYGIKPDFNRVKQPYKNPNDKRIKARIAQGKGARLYDWWEINQVKNTSVEKTAHPCQMPVDVMKRAIGILPDGIGVIDPFCGSGTTGVACKQLGIPFEGYDINEDYCEIARSRIQMVDEMEEDE